MEFFCQVIELKIYHKKKIIELRMKTKGGRPILGIQINMKCVQIVEKCKKDWEKKLNKGL